MAQQQQADKLVQRPLYAFDLPEELLYSLQIKDQHAPASDSSEDAATPGVTSTEDDSNKQDGPASATSCALCGLTFPTLLEQRGHVRSDLHGYNTKLKMRGKKAVDETEFERLVGQLDESISGSESSSSSESDDGGGGAGKQKDSTLSALLKRQAKVTDGDAEDAPARKRKRGAGKAPLLWFTSSKLPSNNHLGIYRAIFSNEEQGVEDHLVNALQRKQLAPKPPPVQKKPKSEDEEDGGVGLPESMKPKGTSAEGPHYFFCMIGGGHFAAMIISLTPKKTRKSGVEDRSATVVAHKTFHRYTTRRKQGGAQSANDNSKGAANSAGSSIRRYNETALIQEVRDLLLEWKHLIDTSDLLFVRASGSTNRRTLFGPYEDQVLSIKDERLRGFPFNTRRATQSELMRAFIELTRVKVNVVDEEALARQTEEAATAATAKAEAAASKPAPTPTKPPKPTKKQEEAAHHTTQLTALIRRSKAPALLTYLRTNDLPASFRFQPQESHHHAPTPLHLAAASNAPACVSALLVKARADPAVTNAEGKTPFATAGDRPTRDAFRLARAELGEEAANWETAGVPAALSGEEAASRALREKQDAAAESEVERKRREGEMERLRSEEARRKEEGKEKVYGKGRVVDKGRLTAEERREEEGRGMSEDVKRRMEREKRARAAEERMKRLQGGGG